MPTNRRTSTNEGNEELIVRYRNEFYDLTNFKRKHPGGINTLKGLENSDMTKRFLRAIPHSDAALYLMNEYKIKDINSNSKHFKLNNNRENGLESNKNRKKDHIPNGQINKEENKLKIILDDSMEHLVDWSKPMIPQIGNICEKYDEWVNKPVDRPLRLFGPWYLEVCTKTPWWLVPLFWLPTITYLIRLGISENFLHLEKRSMLDFPILWISIGFILWSLIEYSLHRWLFHMKTENASRWLCTFHFVMHGLHHKVPFDPYRLVFPPLPAVILASIIYIPVYSILPWPKLLLSGGLIGYVCYDLIHYYLHYGSPNISHLYEMKRYHYQHHFVHHDLGFGISSPIWDKIFGTRIHLRKLKYILKW